MPCSFHGNYYRVIFTNFMIVKDMGTRRWDNWSKFLSTENHLLVTAKVLVGSRANQSQLFMPMGWWHGDFCVSYIPTSSLVTPWRPRNSSLRSQYLLIAGSWSWYQRKKISENQEGSPLDYWMRTINSFGDQKQTINKTKQKQKKHHAQRVEEKKN